MVTTETSARKGPNLEAIDLESLIAQLNLATTGMRKVRLNVARKRVYVDYSISPQCLVRQIEVADEIARRVCRGERLLGASNLLLWEIVTAIDPDSDAATLLVNHLLAKGAIFSDVHSMLDYCASYWPKGHRLTAEVLNRLENIAVSLHSPEDQATVVALRKSHAVAD